MSWELCFVLFLLLFCCLFFSEIINNLSGIDTARYTSHTHTHTHFFITFGAWCCSFTSPVQHTLAQKQGLIKDVDLRSCMQATPQTQMGCLGVLRVYWSLHLSGVYFMCAVTFCRCGCLVFIVCVCVTVFNSDILLLCRSLGLPMAPL